MLGQCWNEGQKNKCGLELARPWVGISGKFYSFGIPLLPQQHEIATYFFAFAVGYVLSAIHYRPLRSTQRGASRKVICCTPSTTHVFSEARTRKSCMRSRSSRVSRVSTRLSGICTATTPVCLWYFERAHHGTHRVLGYYLFFSGRGRPWR